MKEIASPIRTNVRHLKERPIVDFIYVGAPRSGSTWLAATLDEHPEVFIPQSKEVHYFNDRLIYPFEYKYPHGLEHYRSYFSEAPATSQRGELSPFYYLDPNAAVRMAKDVPDAKILIFLRKPTAVLFSLYLLLRVREKRAESFEDELERTPMMRDLGYYHRLLTPYFDWFPKERIYVAIYEDFFQDELAALPSVLSFLGVDPTFKPSVLNKRVNASHGRPPSVVLGKFRGEVLKTLNRPTFLPVKRALTRLGAKRMDYSGIDKTASLIERPQLDPLTDRRLMAEYEPDIRRLERLLGRNLDLWLEPHAKAA